MTGRGVGLGKIILCGEHAVVYGHPALAMAINLHTEVRLQAIEGPSKVRAEVDERLSEALSLVIPPLGVEISIHSTIPIGRGMGSSAALAVALVRAQAQAAGEASLSPKVVFERAMPIECVFHGDPSGLDVAVSARGGVLRYLRATPPVIEPIGHPPAGDIVVLDTGLTGNTAQLVAGVRARRPAIDPLLDRIGALTSAAIDNLYNPRVLGELLTENHRLLQHIGVSTPELDRLVDLAMQHGAFGAKLAGAGGGGIAIALTNQPDRLLEAAASRGIQAIRCVGAPRE